MGLAMFRSFLFVFAVVTLTAQPVWYTSLSATDDGETLYFASPLILRGSEATVGMHVYRYTSAGIDQVAKVSTSGSGHNRAIFYSNVLHAMFIRAPRK